MTTLTAGCVMLIGETAGAVWKAMAEKGPLSTAKLIKEVERAARSCYAGARLVSAEDKIHIDDSRSRIVSLR